MRSIYGVAPGEVFWTAPSDVGWAAALDLFMLCAIRSHMSWGRRGSYLAPDRSSLAKVAGRWDIPDVCSVFGNGAVRREPAHTGDVEKGSFAPLSRGPPEPVDILLRLPIGREIGCHHVAVRISQRVDQSGEAVRILRGEPAGGQGVDDLGKLRRGGYGARHVEPRSAPLGDVFGKQAEDENIFVTDMVANFDICAVEGSYGQGAVQRQLHVSRSRGLHSRSRDLFRKVGRWDDQF